MSVLASDRRTKRGSVVGVLTGMQSGAVTVRQARCAVVRNRNARCLKCADACTSGCISVVDGALVVDASKCVGCGTCATVCPTCALEAHNPNDAQLFAECLEARVGGSVVIACAPVCKALEGLLEPGRTARVVCLGRVDESLAAQLAAKGVDDIHLLRGECDRCAQHPGLDCALMVADSANALLSAWGSSAHVTVTDDVPGWALSPGAEPGEAASAVAAYFSQPRGNAPVVAGTPKTMSAGRATEAEGCGHAAADQGAAAEQGAATGKGASAERGAATERGVAIGQRASAEQGAVAERGVATGQRASAEQGAATDISTILHVMEDGTLPHFIPDRRDKLLDALSELGEPVAEYVDTRLWGQVVIDRAKCKSCRMCSTFCPTGAIARFDEPDGTFGVEHYPGDCVRCGTCRDICPGHAITILDGVRPAYLFEGKRHRFVMDKRDVTLGEHQIYQTMRGYIDGDVFER
jgi:Fe-S-cluster-containing hydrogenase component 2